MSFRTARSFCVFAASLAFCAGGAVNADAAQGCKLSSLHSAFGYTVTGTINANATPALPPGPFAAVGRIAFDGNGGVSTTRTLSTNGVIIRNDSGLGTYAVNADCTGTFNISIQTPGGAVHLNLDFVLDDDGDEIRAIVTNNGYVLTLTGQAQGKADKE